MTRDQWLLIGACVAVAIIYAGSIPLQPASEPRPAAASGGGFGNAWRQRVIDDLKQGEAIRDATWSGANSLWIGVVDDGSRRDGLAQFACETVNQRKLSDGDRVTVTVWDIAKMTIAQEMKELGRHRCS